MRGSVKAIARYTSLHKNLRPSGERRRNVREEEGFVVGERSVQGNRGGGSRRKGESIAVRVHGMHVGGRKVVVGHRF